jgi:hypothetical protein
VSGDPYDDGRERVLTDAQLAAVSAWLRAAADRLGLRDWRIEVSPYRCEGASSIASSHLRDEADHSWIAVGPRFHEADARERTVTLTHELLHCHYQPVTGLAERLVAGELGKRTESIISAAVSQAEERCIDRLAQAVALFLEPFDLAGAAGAAA